MTLHSDERTGGRLTFGAFILAGVIWLVASSFTAGRMVEEGIAGLVVLVVTGAIIGMMVGFYNFGRERGQ